MKNRRRRRRRNRRRSCCPRKPRETASPNAAKDEKKSLVPERESPPTPVQESSPWESPPWVTLTAAMPGRSHLARGRECQDATAAGVNPRPWLLAADGAGSSDRSQFGSRAAGDVLREQLDILSPLLRRALDDENPRAEITWKNCARWLHRALVARQRSLARAFGGAARDYRFTLAAAILGRRRLGYLQVGDAGLVLRRDDHLLLPVKPHQGEFANQTRFVDPETDPAEALRQGVLPMEKLDGVLAFSDGVSTRALAHTDHAPAPALGQLLDDASARLLNTEDLHSFLADPIWDTSTGDDRCLALLALKKSP